MRLRVRLCLRLHTVLSLHAHMHVHCELRFHTVGLQVSTELGRRLIILKTRFLAQAYAWQVCCASAGQARRCALDLHLVVYGSILRACKVPFVFGSGQTSFTDKHSEVNHMLAWGWSACDHHVLALHNATWQVSWSPRCKRSNPHTAQVICTTVGLFAVWPQRGAPPWRR